MNLLTLVLIWTHFASAEACDQSPGSLNRYESEILSAAETGEPEKIAAPLACILQMQSGNSGFARYLASSYLRPLFGGHQTPGLAKDSRYKAVAKALEQLTMRSADTVRKSFVAEFSKGDWAFYTLFCEEGNTEYCAVFLPDEKRVKGEPPMLAAASLLRLRKAYQVLKGSQRELVAKRIKNLYRDIPETARLQRKFIEQIYNEIFPPKMPLNGLS